MTPAQLEKRLRRIYGKDDLRFHLCVKIAGETGLHADTVLKWLNGVNPIPDWMPLVLDGVDGSVRHRRKNQGKAKDKT